MKKLLTLVSILFAANSFAITVDQFCGQFNWDNEKIQCFKTASGKFVDETALDICQSFSFDSDKMNCMGKVLNKTYSPGEVKACGDMSFESEKLNCLVQLGRVYQPPRTGRQLDDIRKLTIVGMDALRANDLYTVGRVLNQINQISSTPIQP